MRLGAAKDAEITRIRATLASSIGGIKLSMSIDLYQVRPRKDHRGVNLIPTRCHSVSATASRTQSATLLSTRSIAAAHMMRRSASDTRPHPTNIHPQMMKRLFHCKDWAHDSCFHLI
jgi:hypothetical protein